MTIIESIKAVLNEYPDGLTSKEVYEKIIEKGLYSFGAKSPVSVVNGYLRKHCVGIVFPTASPIKHFKITGYTNGKIRFSNINTKDIGTIKSDLESSNNERLPEEKIDAAYNEHIEFLRQQIFDAIIKNSPSFFEHLVMDLLLKMGYGYDDNSGIVTGRSHDGGIDGIINEDKLGFDIIYIQAKRYGKSNTVGRKELQAFVGAMESVQKGVFITTSRFTKEAVSFVNRQSKNIKLIDGELLADLLVKNKVGLSVIQTIELYKIDSDYYGS